MKTIRGYTLLGELTTQDAGFCKWGFCTKDGREFFIKEFLAPVYPTDTDGLSEKIVNRKRKICSDFFNRKSRYYEKLLNCRTGNNILVRQFFRHESKFYIVTDKVESDGTDPALIASLPREKKEALTRSLLYSIARLHSAGLIHADLKPDNILLKRTQDGYYTAKIIDFDAGFIVGEVPDDLQGDFVYLSPEANLKIQGKDVEITEKIDIFALGIILHQYWCGKLPSINEKYNYIFEAAHLGDEIKLDENVPADLRRIIARMLSADPALRPSASQILHAYQIRDEAVERHNMEEQNNEHIKHGNTMGFYTLSDSDL